MALIGSLCTGYGGLDHAVMQLFDSELAFVADVSPGACKLLEYRYPDIPNLRDISQVKWDEIGHVDILTAGFPCQPISQAGRKLGEADERWLWPEVARAVRELRPGLVVLENVAAILVRGLPSVLGDLAEAGYVGSYRCVRASDIGAPHQRERWFAVAADPDQPRLEGHPREERADGEPSEGDRDASWGVYLDAIRRWEAILGRPAPPSALGRRKLNPVFVEWMMGLPEGWVTTVPDLSFTEKLQLLGNGVVPAQAGYGIRFCLDTIK